MNKLITQKVTCESLKSCISFLEQYQESCLFLLGNLDSYGYKLTDHLNSGNYFSIEKDNKVVAVFCLTRRGNLLIQTDGGLDYSEYIYASVRQEPLQVKGLLGPWQAIHDFCEYLKRANLKFTVGFTSKEILYVKSVEKIEYKEKGRESVRLVNESDFESWDECMTLFQTESGLPIQGDVTQRRKLFKEKQARKHCWGYFVGNRLVSTTVLNASYKKMCQVGGVFTLKEWRRKGFSRICLQKQIQDVKDIHGFTKIILFRDIENYGAQKLYEALGFKKIGWFGIIFGDYS